MEKGNREFRIREATTSNLVKQKNKAILEPGHEVRTCRRDNQKDKDKKGRPIEKGKILCNV